MICRLALAGIVSAMLSLPAGADSCIETFYSKTITSPRDNWVVHLSNGTAFRIGGSDFIFPDTWKPGEETGVCTTGDPHTFAITNLWRKETVIGWPKDYIPPE